MDLLTLLMIAVGLSMDAFSVAICKGLAIKRATLRNCSIVGLWFGGFQALMPIVGYFVGINFRHSIESFDHWIAFGLLGIIGINMLKEAFEKGEECEDCKGADFSMQTMFVMAIATSIDALAVGISLAMAGDVNIWVAIALIGAFTFLMSAIGVKIGNVFGAGDFNLNRGRNIGF